MLLVEILCRIGARLAPTQVAGKVVWPLRWLPTLGNSVPNKLGMEKLVLAHCDPMVSAKLEGATGQAQAMVASRLQS